MEYADSYPFYFNLLFNSPDNGDAENSNQARL